MNKRPIKINKIKKLNKPAEDPIMAQGKRNIISRSKIKNQISKTKKC
jgi:hypothetical protein